MSNARFSRPVDGNGSSHTSLYVGVVIVEALVIATLWLFGWHFGS